MALLHGGAAPRWVLRLLPHAGADDRGRAAHICQPGDGCARHRPYERAPDAQCVSCDGLHERPRGRCDGPVAAARAGAEGRGGGGPGRAQLQEHAPPLLQSWLSYVGFNGLTKLNGSNQASGTCSAFPRPHASLRCPPLLTIPFPLRAGERRLHLSTDARAAAAARARTGRHGDYHGPRRQRVLGVVRLRDAGDAAVGGCRCVRL